MNSKTYSIGVLSITAMILLIAQFIPVQPAMGELTIRDRSYSLVTAHDNKGGELVYVIKHNTGQVAVFTWDVGRRALQFQGAGPLSEAFK